jgi:hypothetical protein
VGTGRSPAPANVRGQRGDFFQFSARSIVVPFDRAAGIDAVAALDGDLTGEVQVVVSDCCAFAFIVDEIAVVIGSPSTAAKRILP